MSTIQIESRRHGYGRASWLWLLAILGMLGAALVVYRQPLLEWLVLSDSVRLQERVQALIGSRPDRALMVTVGGRNTVEPLSEVLPAGAILAKYSDGCPPCKMLVDQYLARASLTERPAPRPLYLISFHADAPFPAGIAADRQLRAAFDPAGTWFDGGMTPMVYRLGAGKELVEVMVGLDPFRLDPWFDPADSAPIAALGPAQP